MRPNGSIRWPVLAVALAVPLVAVACASSGDGDEAADTGTTGPSADADTSADDPEVAAASEALVGRWAHFDVVAYEDDVLRTLIVSTGFSDLELREDGRLWNQMVFCHADVVNEPGIEVSISDAATGAILPIATPVEVTVTDGRVRVRRPPTPTAIGIRLEDPANEALPTDPDDPRVFDADGDGNPGVTSQVTFGDTSAEIYLARREIFSYDLVEQTPDRLVGSVTDRSEQLVIGASDPSMNAPVNWTQLDDPSRNPVIWQRVDPSWDCDRLAAERDTLFPPNPTIDF